MCFGIVLHQAAYGKLPTVFNYTGYLTHATGGGAVNSHATVHASLFDHETHGEILWTETQEISIVNGAFSISLGKHHPLGPELFNGLGDLYLEIKIDHEVLSPRQRLGAVPYALVCKDVVGGVNASSVQVNGSNVINSSGEWVGSMTAFDNEVTRIIQDLGLTNGGNQSVHLSGDVTGSGTGTIQTSISNGAVTLGTKTSGNYVATVGAGSNLSVSGSGSPTAAVTIGMVANPSFSTSVTTPVVSSGTGALTLTAASNKISFQVQGTERSYLDTSGNLFVVGSVTGTNISGTNTGDQTISLTGDVTGSGTGIFATTIANNAVTLGTKTSGNYVATVSAGSNMSVSGSGSPTAAVSVSTVANPSFPTSVTTPLLSNSAGGGTLTINATTSSGADKMSFTFGTAGSGTQMASLDKSGNFFAVGSVTGTNLSGTNTGDQTISLTGDVTGSGTGTFATTIANNAVTLGTKTSGNYVATVAAGTNMSVSGSGSPTAAISVSTVANPSFSTSVTTPAVTSNSALTVTGTGTLTLAAAISGVNDKISFHVDGTEMSYIDASGNFVAVGSVTAANLSGTNTGDQTISLTGDVTGSGTGTFATTIANNAVTLGTKTSGNYVATVAAGSNMSVSGSGSPTAAISVSTVANPSFSTSVTTPLFTNAAGGGTLTINATTSSGVDKMSFTFGTAGSGTQMASLDKSGNLITVGSVTGANLSGTNTGDQTISLTGDVTGSGTGTFATTIANNAVTLGTKTSGNYVATVAAGTNMSVSGSGSPTAAVTIGIVANPTFSTSVTTPAVSNSSALTVTGTGTLTLAAAISGVNDKISFHVDGTEMSYIDSSGNLAAVGNVSGANLSGTNTGDQTISLTGDVTGSGTGTFAATIANNAVTLGTKTSGNYVATVAAGSNMSVSGSGSPTAAITVGTVANPSFSTSVTTPAVTSSSALTVTGTGTLTLAAATSGVNDKISFHVDGIEMSYIDSSGNFVAVGNVTGANLSGTNTGDQTISLTGDVTGSGTGTFATTIANNAVTLGTKTSGNYVATVAAGTNMSVSGSGSPTAAVSVSTVANPSFSTSVTTPLFTNAAGGGTLTINATTSAGTDTMSFTFGTAGSGTQVASLDENGNLSATGNIKTTNGCFGRTYIVSSANSTGGAGSRSAADALCNTARTKSKVCTYDELVESSRCGVTMPSAQGWINSAVQSDCNAWTSGSVLANGISWNTSGYAASTLCSTSQPFLCCQ